MGDVEEACGMLAGLGAERDLFQLLEGLTGAEAGLSKADVVRLCSL